jgi:NADPH2:quinone reductase
MDELLGWLATGRIKPLVTAHYPLENAALALRDLLARRATGKIVITTERGRAAAGGRGAALHWSSCAA